MGLGWSLTHLVWRRRILLSASALEIAWKMALASFMTSFFRGQRLRAKTRFFILWNTHSWNLHRRRDLPPNLVFVLYLAKSLCYPTDVSVFWHGVVLLSLGRDKGSRNTPCHLHLSNSAH